MAVPAAVPANQGEVAATSKANSAPVVAARNPLPYNLKPPIYSGPSNTFSMFPLEPNSEADVAAFAVPQPVAMKHPIAAVGLTIALAFLVSTGNLFLRGHEPGRRFAL